MVNAYNYSNTALQTTLSGNISGAATSITVALTTGFPATTPYVLALDYGAATEELVVVTGVAGTTLTVTRAFSGTSAQSHSIGAVVRHVVNAQDLTDFRTHEAATASVHGVTGALVGATQAQTLTNKTLTSPTINSGALSGTFTGTPAFSGAVTLNGGAALAGVFTGNPIFSGSPQFAGTPTVTGLLQSTRTNATDAAMATILNAVDTSDRWRVYQDGKQEWGPGTATRDTNLYRSAADTLRTDDSFVVNSNLTVGSTTWTTYTPTVTGGGTATWTDRTGYYYKLGKIVHVVVYLAVNVAGSGATTVSIDMPSSVDRTTRQVMLAYCDGIAAGFNGTGTVVAFTSGSGATLDRLRTFDNQNITGAQLSAAGNVTIVGWYREA